MKDVMIDIETFGNGKNALICQIGGIYFDRKTGETSKHFKVNIDARSVEKSGGQFDADTVYWWLSQSRDAIDSITSDPKFDITVAMNDFNDFLKDADAVWSHATFDFVIVTETLKRLGIKPKFPYKVARDIRTLTDLAKVNTKKPRSGIHHDALDDCKYQIAYCVEAMNKLGV